MKGLRASRLPCVSNTCLNNVEGAMHEPRQQIRAGTTMGHEVRSEMGRGSEREIASNRKLGGIWGETPQPLPCAAPDYLLSIDVVVG